MTTTKGMVFLNDQAWKTLKTTIKNLNPTRIFIIVDENTERECLPYFKRQFIFDKDFHLIQIPSGERYKNLDTCLLVWKTLSGNGADRKSLVINLGGGVVTDLGGFAASTFMRGISFINIPTSLLAMVDASVGGKTGVDLDHIKNQIGVIELPEMVLIDPEFLQTLPENQLLSGFAEMIKHSLIDGEESWNEIRTFDPSTILKQSKFLQKSIQIKEKIVLEDPKEQGKRKLLNFGHTLGHAIESHFLNSETKTQLLHGEAIAIGMILASYLSYEMCTFPKTKVQEISTYLVSLFPKQKFSEKDTQSIIKLMSFDKKNRNDKVLFVLMEDFGSFKTDCVVDNQLIIKAFEFYRDF